MTALKIRRRRILSLGAAILVMAAAAIGVTSVAAGGSAPTKGAIPHEAFKPDGIDLSLAPDFVQAVGRNGDVVGYIPKEYFVTQTGPVTDAPLGPDGRPTSNTKPVYGDDLKTLVGHFVPGIGFVPIGTDPRTVPSFVVEAAPAP
jgi:hypothetical protein